MAFSLFTLRTLAYTNNVLVAIRDQADLETLETSLHLHAVTSNAKANRYRSKMILLNGVKIHTFQYDQTCRLWGDTHCSTPPSLFPHSLSTPILLSEWK
jgi:hypothetical protein